MSTKIPKPLRVAAGRSCRKDYMPIGSVVVRRDTSSSGRHTATRYIKINDAFPTGKRWIAYARWWWEQNQGPVPKGQRVLRKDGDTMNDDPSNLFLGTPGQNLNSAHKRDKTWSKEQHARAAAGCAALNRKRGQIRRSTRLQPRYWYPVVGDLSTILNIPFRRRKRLLACFGADVGGYPASGHGQKPSSVVQRAIHGAKVLPVRGLDLSERRYISYGILDPASKTARGPCLPASRSWPPSSIAWGSGPTPRNMRRKT